MTDAAAESNLFDTTAEAFITDVIERSRRQTIAVDFWAPWCGPCKALAPVLEQLVTHYAGRLAVARVNTDEQQAIAAQFGIRGIPDVRIFRDGRQVDGFVGVQPFARLQTLFDRHVPRASEAPRQGARELLAAGRVAEAIAEFDAVLAKDPANTATVIDLADAHARLGNLEQAEALLAKLPPNAATGPAVDQARARIQFVRDAPSPEDGEALRASVDPATAASRDLYRLAAHELLRGDAAVAVELLLTLVRRDRRFEDGLPKRALINAFTLLGEHDVLVAVSRRKLAALLH